MLSFISKTQTFDWLSQDYARELGWDRPKIHLKTWQDMAIWSHLREAKGQTIAEIGGGDTRILRKLAPRNTCTNVDKFEGLDGGPGTPVDIPRVRNVLAYMGERHADLADNSFDVVFSVSVVEHVPDDRCTAFMDDCLRILKPGGLCLHAIDLYVRDTPAPGGQKRLDIYTGWANRPDVTPLGEITATSAKFSAAYASNPDLTMWNWSKRGGQMAEMRKQSQSVSLFLGLRKNG